MWLNSFHCRRRQNIKIGFTLFVVGLVSQIGFSAISNEEALGFDYFKIIGMSLVWRITIAVPVSLPTTPYCFPLVLQRYKRLQWHLVMLFNLIPIACNRRIVRRLWIRAALMFRCCVNVNCAAIDSANFHEQRPLPNQIVQSRAAAVRT